MYKWALAFIAIIIALNCNPAKAQTSCTPQTQTQLLSSFADNVPVGSITPLTMRNFVCSALQLGVSAVTSNSSNLNNGINITSGYNGILDNSVQLRYINQTVYGSENCQTQMFKIFNVTRGFFTMQGNCGTFLGGGVSQFIPGLFSVDDFSGLAAIPIVGQSIAEVSNEAEYGINTVHLDSPIMATSSSSSISGTVLTVGGSITGTWAVGDYVFFTGVTPGTKITSLGTGTGGAGTYNINNSQSAGAQTMTDHLGTLSQITLQDESDYFGYNSDTVSRFLVDGFFFGPASINNIRSGFLVGLFSGSLGVWQNGFFAGSGCCTVGMLVGTTNNNAPVTGTLSQLAGFSYTDNTNSSDRRVYLNADPTNAGLTGADLILSSSYGGPANFSIATGSFKADGKNIVDSSGNAVHQIFVSHAESVTGNATTCVALEGTANAVACGAPAGNTLQVQTNQNGQISNLIAHVATAPGTGNSYVVTLLANSGATALTCTISNAATACPEDTTDKIAITTNTKLVYQVVASTSAPTAQMTVSVSFDNPAP